MSVDILWRLPVSPTRIDDGPNLEVRDGRDVAIGFAYEDESTSCAIVKNYLVFHDVEAFKCTYYKARGSGFAGAYGRLIDKGLTGWLLEVQENLGPLAAATVGLRHLVIDFDDGPAFELICKLFTVEDAEAEAPVLVV